MESKKPVLKNERELKQEEEKRDKSVQERDGTVTELERLKNIEKTQLSVSQIQKISKLRGQIANQEMMIEKMRRENEKLKDRTRIYSSSHMDPELEMAMRMSELENSHAYRAPTGLNEAEIDNLPMFAIDYPSQCIVCKDQIPIDHIVKSLPFCGHLGHQPCIDQWLLRKNICPECSTPVLS